MCTEYIFTNIICVKCFVVVVVVVVVVFVKTVTHSDVRSQLVEIYKQNELCTQIYIIYVIQHKLIYFYRGCVGE